MDSIQRPPEDSRPDPLEMQPDCGGGGDYDRWQAGEKLADERETEAAYDAHKRRFLAAGGKESKFNGLGLMAAARLSAMRILNGLKRDHATYERKATEHEIRGVLSDLAKGANQAMIAGRLRAFQRQIWPSGPPRSDGESATGHDRDDD